MHSSKDGLVGGGSCAAVQCSPAGRLKGRTTAHGSRITYTVFVFGCASQVARYLTPAMVQEAARHGVELVLINPDVPLEAQGPFNGIIHKLPPNKGMHTWVHSTRAACSGSWCCQRCVLVCACKSAWPCIALVHALSIPHA